MEDSTTALPKPVSMGQKVAFGFGMLANQMFPAALGVFIIVLVQDLGFAALLWGVIQFLPRIFDAITDPIMGFISDNTRSKWGRRRAVCVLRGDPDGNCLRRHVAVAQGRRRYLQLHLLPELVLSSSTWA